MSTTCFRRLNGDVSCTEIGSTDGRLFARVLRELGELLGCPLIGPLLRLGPGVVPPLLRNLVPLTFVGTPAQGERRASLLDHCTCLSWGIGGLPARAPFHWKTAPLARSGSSDPVDR